MPSKPLAGPGSAAFLAAALPLLALSLIGNLGLGPAYLEEPRRALVAMEMMFRGEYIVPSQLGEPYVNKPPVFNWVLVLFYRLSGNFGEFWPRLVSVLSLLGMGALIGAVVWRYGSQAEHPPKHRDRAWGAALLTVMAADLYFYFATTGEIDLFYSLITLGSMLAIYVFDRPGRANTLALYTLPWLLAALGSLTKGFPSPLFAGLSYLAWFGLRREWRKLFHPAHALGLGLFAALVGGYFYAYHLRADLGFYLEGLLNQSSQRTVAEHGLTDLLRHLLIFPADTLKNILPASLMLPLLLSSRGRDLLRRQPLLQFLLLIFAANAWVYWISPGTRARYVYMLYPLLIAPLVWARELASARSERLASRAMDALSVLLVLAVAVLPQVLRPGGNPWSLGLLAWSLAAALAAAALLLGWARRRFEPLARLMLVLITARLLFNACLLPARAVQGEAPQWKAWGLEIAESSRGQPLRLLGFRDAGNFPLSTAYYIERERREVLVCDRQPQPGVWYLAEPWQLDTSRATRHGGFMWKGLEFGLYAYRGAADEPPLPERPASENPAQPAAEPDSP
jgi:4-amino-4-deoxy-L-arabinose transferase-like glycosyltransferase